MNELEARLASLAAAGQTVTYGALARDLGLRIGALTAGLEQLMALDAAQGRPLRAAVCEAKLAGGLPARGFFDLAAELGYDVSDPVAFTTRQRDALHRLSDQ